MKKPRKVTGYEGVPPFPKKRLAKNTLRNKPSDLYLMERDPSNPNFVKSDN